MCNYTAAANDVAVSLRWNLFISFCCSFPMAGQIERNPRNSWITRPLHANESYGGNIRKNFMKIRWPSVCISRVEPIKLIGNATERGHGNRCLMSVFQLWQASSFHAAGGCCLDPTLTTALSLSAIKRKEKIRSWNRINGGRNAVTKGYHSYDDFICRIAHKSLDFFTQYTPALLKFKSRLKV